MGHLLLLILIWSGPGFAQKLLLPNEETVLSFQTNNGKTMMLAKDKADAYLVYRFGTDQKIELEFPARNKESWQKFTYNYYFRGGGKQNAGVDIDNIRFTNQGFEYVIYASYSAGDDEENAEESYSVGIIIHDRDGKDFRINGNAGTKVGSLQDFRTNGSVKIDELSGLEQ